MWMQYVVINKCVWVSILQWIEKTARNNSETQQCRRRNYTNSYASFVCFMYVLLVSWNFKKKLNVILIYFLQCDLNIHSFLYNLIFVYPSTHFIATAIILFTFHCQICQGWAYYPWPPLFSYALCWKHWKLPKVWSLMTLMPTKWPLTTKGAPIQ